jgi:MYXO-CTERM domain-containing protein
MRTALFAASAAALLAGTATASMTGAVAISYSVTAVDFGGASVTVNVQDLYMTSDDAADTLLNVYNLTTAATGASSYFQSFTGTGWQPTNLGGPFDTEALQIADSFVTIGGFGADGRQTPGAGAGTGLDPNFGGNTAAAPGALAGWYNGSPPSLNGAVMDYDAISSAVLIGRFASTGEFDLIGSTLEVTWNQGLGTPGQQAGFTVTPAPGALALLGLAGVAGRRRRNG